MSHLTPELVEHLANLKALSYEIQINWQWEHGDYHIYQSMNVLQIWFDAEGSVWFHTDAVFKIDATSVKICEVSVLSPEKGGYSRVTPDWTNISTGDVK